MDIIKSPLPGKIVTVKVKTSDKVKEGDILLTIESMKMENEIPTPRGGIIKNVKVSPNDLVKVGADLVILE